MLHLPLYVQGAWLVGAMMFIFGLKGMGSPTTARKGIVWAGVGVKSKSCCKFTLSNPSQLTN